MALIIAGKTPCQICGEVLEADADVFATSGAFLEPELPLWRFCDAAMHWDCYAEWPHRREFARRYFEACLAGSELNPYWGVALRTDQVFVELSPMRPVEQVRVHLCETGSVLTLRLANWQAWLWENPAECAHHAAEAAAIRQVVPELRDAVPTREALVSRVDWGARDRLLEKMRAEEAETRLRDERERQKHARERYAAFQQTLRDAVTCPHCGEAERIRVIDHGLERESYFVCRGCARSFLPPDIPDT